MAWLWESWEEFVRYINPASVQRGSFQHTHHATEMELLRDLLESVKELAEASAALFVLGFDGKNISQPKDKVTISHGRDHVIRVVHTGEMLLLHHKRLALSEASYGFLHQHNILEHWDRYAASTRISHEIHQLTKDVDDLLEGYERLAREDDRLIVDGLDLPEELKCDFQLARNLFSIGLDDVGLFMAGRGLEKVLRQIARERKVFATIRNKNVTAEHADFYDLIETLSRVRWKARDVPLILPDTKALLHYLRSIRNRGAHKGQAGAEVEGAREKACVIANTAAQLWNSVDGNRARLAHTIIQKDW